jgi:hypothetical protein
MNTTTTSRAALIAAANDRYRRRLAVLDFFANGRTDGRTVMTSGIAALPERQQLSILHAVASFDTFTRDNDPHGEHDFGLVIVDGARVFFKFDYYDSAAMEWGADDPQLSCYRLLTIMLAEEY